MHLVSGVAAWLAKISIPIGVCELGLACCLTIATGQPPVAPSDYFMVKIQTLVRTAWSPMSQQQTAAQHMLKHVPCRRRSGGHAPTYDGVQMNCRCQSRPARSVHAFRDTRSSAAHASSFQRLGSLLDSVFAVPSLKMEMLTSVSIHKSRSGSRDLSDAAAVWMVTRASAPSRITAAMIEDCSGSAYTQSAHGVLVLLWSTRPVPGAEFTFDRGDAARSVVACVASPKAFDECTVRR